MKGTNTASAHTVTALPDTCLMIVRRPGAATTGWDAEGAPPGKSWCEGKTASDSRARAGLQLVPSGSDPEATAAHQNGRNQAVRRHCCPLVKVRYPGLGQ